MKTKKAFQFIRCLDLLALSFNLFFLFSLLSACNDGGIDEVVTEGEKQEEEQEWVYKLEGLDENIDASGGSINVKVYSNKEWRLLVNKPWISLSRNTGEACLDSPIEVQINSEFNFYDEREVVLTLFIYDGVSIGKHEYTLKQQKYQRHKTKYQVGDPEVTFDESKFSESYKYNPQMQIWRGAGKSGGIPHLEDQLKEVTQIFEPGTSAKTIKDYFELNKYKKVIALLKNGDYTVNIGIRLYANAVLIGESRDGVVMTIDPSIPPKTFGVISLYNTTNVGLRNVTIKGGWLNEDGQNYPKYNDLNHEELIGMGDFMTINLRDSKNCYVDNVRLINNASHPIWTGGNNNTIRNVEMDGAFCKSDGCQGYFYIAGNNQLVTNCRITRLRHISMQGVGSKNNVFYDNDIQQEVSFHDNDGGGNLIENNRIYLPKTMAGAYNPIMGPWSTQHKVGGKNFIYNNKCKEDNRKGMTPWSDNQLYLGPYEVSVGSDNPSRYTNFRPVDPLDFPSGGTLYPVVLD